MLVAVLAAAWIVPNHLNGGHMASPVRERTTVASVVDDTPASDPVRVGSTRPVILTRTTINAGWLHRLVHGDTVTEYTLTIPITSPSGALPEHVDLGAALRFQGMSALWACSTSNPSLQDAGMVRGRSVILACPLGSGVLESVTVGSRSTS